LPESRSACCATDAEIGLSAATSTATAAAVAAVKYVVRIDVDALSVARDGARQQRHRQYVRRAVTELRSAFAGRIHGGAHHFDGARGRETAEVHASSRSAHQLEQRGKRDGLGVRMGLDELSLKLRGQEPLDPLLDSAARPTCAEGASGI